MDHTNTSVMTAGSGNTLLEDTYLRCTPMSSPGLTAIIRKADWQILFVNKPFEHYIGYTNGDLAGEGVYFKDLLEPYQHDRLENQLTNITESVAARSHYFIYPMKSKSGKVANYYLYASPIEEVNETYGQLYYLLLLPDHSKWGMPFTSFESKELFLEQFDSEDFGTFERNLNADKVFWSAGLYRIFGVDERLREISTAFAVSFIHPSDSARARTVTEEALATGADINIELKVITVHSQVKIIHCLARIVRNEAGIPMLITGSIRDITEQRSIEENLRSKVEELNHSNKELAEFAYVASHDLQEPLRKITTFSDRLSEKYKSVLTGDGAMYLARMTASAENMRILINDLLEFSRISKTTLPYEQVDLNKTLQQVLTDLELVTEETGTEITSDTLPVIEAVSSQMKQLLTNIINNAIKFHKEGVAPVISIQSTPLPAHEKLQYELAQGATYYKIQITDNGIGFENEYATRIFQVFQRLHGKSEYPGSGIGLAICKKIMEYHYGAIFAENIPSTGARFTFIIPKDQPKTKRQL